MPGNNNPANKRGYQKRRKEKHNGGGQYQFPKKYAHHSPEVPHTPYRRAVRAVFPPISALRECRKMSLFFADREMTKTRARIDYQRCLWEFSM